VESFGSVDEFKSQFSAAGAGQFGSGWCWLVKDTDGALKVTKTENGVNPLCFGQTALLGCDVWEHSYYIDFRNKRPGLPDELPRQAGELGKRRLADVSAAPSHSSTEGPPRTGGPLCVRPRSNGSPRGGGTVHDP
jgi:hypothetical protein